MATGSNVINQLVRVSTAPTNGNGSNCLVSFGGTQVLQACSNIYLDVVLSDPTNTGDPATFEVEIVGGIPSGANLIATITSPGLITVEANSPVTFWQANLVSLSGGVAPLVSVYGITGG